MSLRDQLLAKGLVSKKRAKKLDRETHERRKKAHGNQASKKVRDVEAEQAAVSTRAAKKAAKLAARQKREAQREAYERVLRIRQLLTAHRVRTGGPVGFHHRGLDGAHVVQTRVNTATAAKIRSGELAIAGQRIGPISTIAVIPRGAADKLDAFAPETLLFYNRDNSGIGAEELQSANRSWEPDLRAHRATAEDIARFRTKAMGSGHGD
jgi:uncharacterized protein YaiL (DUF2058 family)